MLTLSRVYLHQAEILFWRRRRRDQSLTTAIIPETPILLHTNIAHYPPASVETVPPIQNRSISRDAPTPDEQQALPADTLQDETVPESSPDEAEAVGLAQSTDNPENAAEVLIQPETTAESERYSSIEVKVEPVDDDSALYTTQSLNIAKEVHHSAGPSLNSPMDAQHLEPESIAEQSTLSVDRQESPESVISLGASLTGPDTQVGPSETAAAVNTERAARSDGEISDHFNNGADATTSGYAFGSPSPGFESPPKSIQRTYSRSPEFASNSAQPELPTYPADNLPTKSPKNKLTGPLFTKDGAQLQPAAEQTGDRAHTDDLPPPGDDFVESAQAAPDSRDHKRNNAKKRRLDREYDGPSSPRKRKSGRQESRRGDSDNKQMRRRRPESSESGSESDSEDASERDERRSSRSKKRRRQVSRTRDRHSYRDRTRSSHRDSRRDRRTSRRDQSRHRKRRRSPSYTSSDYSDISDSDSRSTGSSYSGSDSESASSSSSEDSRISRRSRKHSKARSSRRASVSSRRARQGSEDLSREQLAHKHRARPSDPREMRNRSVVPYASSARSPSRPVQNNYGFPGEASTSNTSQSTRPPSATSSPISIKGARQRAESVGAIKFQAQSTAQPEYVAGAGSIHFVNGSGVPYSGYGGAAAYGQMSGQGGMDAMQMQYMQRQQQQQEMMGMRPMSSGGSAWAGDPTYNGRVQSGSRTPGGMRSGYASQPNGGFGSGYVGDSFNSNGMAGGFGGASPPYNGYDMTPDQGGRGRGGYRGGGRGGGYMGSGPSRPQDGGWGTGSFDAGGNGGGYRSDFGGGRGRGGGGYKRGGGDSWVNPESRFNRGGGASGRQSGFNSGGWGQESSAPETGWGQGGASTTSSSATTWGPAASSTTAPTPAPAPAPVIKPAPKPVVDPWANTAAITDNDEWK